MASITFYYREIKKARGFLESWSGNARSGEAYVAAAADIIGWGAAGKSIIIRANRPAFFHFSWPSFLPSGARVLFGSPDPLGVLAKRP